MSSWPAQNLRLLLRYQPRAELGLSARARSTNAIIAPITGPCRCERATARLGWTAAIPAAAIAPPGSTEKLWEPRAGLAPTAEVRPDEGKAVRDGAFNWLVRPPPVQGVREARR